MLSVEEAQDRIVAATAPLAAEQVSLADALGRVLAEDLAARRTQPPTDVSAMDGYAVRAEDVAKPPVTLDVVGYAPAGGAHDSRLGAGQAVRIFTGGPVPDGADAIVIQENTEAAGSSVTVRKSAAEGTYIRPAGLDFRTGDLLLEAGQVMTARGVGLAAAMNRPWLMVRRKPRVAILATGDEIVMPGDPVAPHQIVSSNGLALAAAVRAFGGEPILLGIAPDDRDALARMAESARGADLLLTTGGASVGDHDLVKSVLGESGLEIDFWRIAMRPGKPLMFGHYGETLMIGLPGNPVSTVVCAIIFVLPALAGLLGADDVALRPKKAVLGSPLPENDRRQDYLRATATYDADGNRVVTAFDRQDSSMMAPLTHADCLIVRLPHAPAAHTGQAVEVLDIPPGV